MITDAMIGLNHVLATQRYSVMRPITRIHLSSDTFEQLRKHYMADLDPELAKARFRLNESNTLLGVPLHCDETVELGHWQAWAGDEPIAEGAF